MIQLAMLIWAAPKMLRQQIADVKANLTSPTGKFGVDLAIPQVGNQLHVQTPRGVARSRDRARWEEVRAKRTTTTRMAERTHLPTDHRLSAPNSRRSRAAARPLPMHQSRNLPRSHDLPELADIIISEGAPRSYRI